MKHFVQSNNICIQFILNWVLKFGDFCSELTKNHITEVKNAY